MGYAWVWGSVVQQDTGQVMALASSLQLASYTKESKCLHQAHATK